MNEVKKLQQIGLSKKEAMLYAASLEVGPSAAAVIAKKAGIERTAVYKTLDDLVDQGLIYVGRNGSRREFTAADPRVLLKVLANKQDILAQTLPLLTGLQGSSSAEPKVKIYNSIDGVRRVYNESLQSKDLLRRDFISIDSVSDLLGSTFLQNHIEKRLTLGISVRSLRWSSDEKTKNWYLRHSNNGVDREVRFLNSKADHAPLIMTYDNRIVMITSHKDLFALQIESKELAAACKALFDIAWANAKSA